MKDMLGFSIVGMLGMCSNLSCFILLSTLHIPHLINATLCFLLSVSQNYVLNALFTFKRAPNVLAYGSYICANLLGLIINLCVLALLESYALTYILTALESFTLALNYTPQALHTFNPSLLDPHIIHEQMRPYALAIAQAFALLCAFMSNFCLSKYLIFKGKHHE